MSLMWFGNLNWPTLFLRSPQSGRSWLSPGPGPGLKSPRFVRLAERAQGFGERLATPCARSARREFVFIFSGGLAPGYGGCARSARLTSNETRPSWPNALVLRSPQSGRSWLSPGPGPGLKFPRFVRLAERAQACAGRLPSTPCGSHMLAQGRAASAETLGLRSPHFSDPLRVAQRLARTLCDPQGVGNSYSWLTQGRGDPGLACATRRGSSDKSELSFSLPQRGSRQIAQGVDRGTRANPGWGIPPIRAPEGRPELSGNSGQVPAAAVIEDSSATTSARRTWSGHRISQAMITTSITTSCRDRNLKARLKCQSRHQSRHHVAIHAFRQPACFRKLRRVRSAGYLIRIRSQPNAQGLTHV